MCALYTKHSDANENRLIRTQPDDVRLCCAQQCFTYFYFFLCLVLFFHLLHILTKHKMELGKEKIEYVCKVHRHAYNRPSHTACERLSIKTNEVSLCRFPVRVYVWTSRVGHTVIETQEGISTHRYRGHMKFRCMHEIEGTRSNFMSSILMRENHYLRKKTNEDSLAIRLPISGLIAKHKKETYHFHHFLTFFC